MGFRKPEKCGKDYTLDVRAASAKNCGAALEMSMSLIGLRDAERRRDVTKVTPQRAVDILEQFGPQMICVNSASDWGESGPSNLTDTCLEYRNRGHSEAEATEVFYNNPCRFFGQNPKWKLKPI